MQIDTTMQYHYRPMRIANIKNIVATPSVGKDAEKQSPIHCRWECKMVQHSLWQIA